MSLLLSPAVLPHKNVEGRCSKAASIIVFLWWDGRTDNNVCFHIHRQAGDIVSIDTGRLGTLYL